jgi:hypothetical protein
VVLDRGDLELYLGVLCLRSGRRDDALRHLAKAAGHGKLLAAGRGLAWIARDRLPAPLLRTLQQRKAKSDRWRAEAKAWLDRLPEDGH